MILFFSATPWIKYLISVLLPQLSINLECMYKKADIINLIFFLFSLFFGPVLSVFCIYIITYRYLIYVEGHVAAFRYGSMMKLDAVILKVEASCNAGNLWMSPLLEPMIVC